MTDTKIISGKRYHRYEYHGKKTMPKTEAEEGMEWFRSRYTRDYRGKVVATIRKVKEPDGHWSLWHRSNQLEKKWEREEKRKK
jgi:hypothetical protein